MCVKVGVSLTQNTYLHLLLFFSVCKKDICDFLFNLFVNVIMQELFPGVDLEMATSFHAIRAVLLWPTGTS